VSRPGGLAWELVGGETVVRVRDNGSSEARRWGLGAGNGEEPAGAAAEGEADLFDSDLTESDLFGPSMNGAGSA
jgi:hypothetical protein